MMDVDVIPAYAGMQGQTWIPDQSGMTDTVKAFVRHYTRHASVDSFGLGMVLYFLVSGQNPVPNQNLHAKWEDDVTRAAEARPCSTWCSTPRRIARLILSSTRQEQGKRWDMAQIQSELERLSGAESAPNSVRSAELLAEELAYRCGFMKGYEWSDNKLAAVKGSPSGSRFELRGDESRRRIYFDMAWGDPGVMGKKHLGKWIVPASNAAADILRGAGWQVEQIPSRYASIRLLASIAVDEALASLQKTVDCLQRSSAQLKS